MNDQPAIDARTSPSTVWKLVEHLTGDDLVAWRMADLPGRLSAEERNLTEPFPFVPEMITLLTLFWGEPASVSAARKRERS